MEVSNTEIKNGLGEKLQIGIFILTLIAICSFIVAIIVLTKNIDEIKENPIVYGINKYELDSCTCFDNSGGFVDFYNSKREVKVEDSTS